MAIKLLTLTCDECLEERDDFEDVTEAHDYGWLVLQGPDRILGSDERAFCSVECLQSFLA